MRWLGCAPSTTDLGRCGMLAGGKEIRFMLRRSAVLLAVISCLALVAAGCGSKSSSSTSGGTVSTSTTHLAKTKFVFHAGLAFGAFHHFVYKPFRAGDFKHPLSHKLTVAKA